MYIGSPLRLLIFSTRASLVKRFLLKVILINHNNFNVSFVQPHGTVMSEKHFQTFLS